MIKGVQPVPVILPLFNDLYQRNHQDKREQERKEITDLAGYSVQISPLGKLSSDLEGVTDSHKIAVRIKQACTELGIVEVDLKKFMRNSQFLAAIEGKGGYNSISAEHKLPLLAKLAYYGADCPVAKALTSGVEIDLGRKPLIDFTQEEINRTFKNEYVASKNRIRSFEAKYSKHLQSR